MSIALRTFTMLLSRERPLAGRDSVCAELDAFGERFGAALRSVWAAVVKNGGDWDAPKKELCARFCLPARIYNSIVDLLKAMVASKQEKAKSDIEDLDAKLRRLFGKLAAQEARQEKRRKQANAEEVVPTPAERARATRWRLRMEKLRAKEKLLEAVSIDPFPSLCFGSRGLFAARNRIELGGFENTDAWRDAWRERRSAQVYVIGSNDEAGGNKTCRATIREIIGADGLVREVVDLALATTAGRDAEKIVIQGVALPHGHVEWLAAIKASQSESSASMRWQRETAAIIAAGGRLPISRDALRDNWRKPKAKRKTLEELFRSERAKARKAAEKTGFAITYRFTRVDFGWRLGVTISQSFPEIPGDRSKGGLGIDFNPDLLALSFVDSAGRFAGTLSLPLRLRGASSGERDAMLSAACREAVMEAKARGLTLFIEELDFRRKKAELSDASPERARTLSSMAYSAFNRIIRSHARLAGVRVETVDPAYTSVQGAVLWSAKFSLSIHASAAISIARRGLGFTEAVPVSAKVPACGKIHEVMLAEHPLRRARKEVVDWSAWAKALSTLRSAERDARRRELRTGKQRRSELADRRSLDGITIAPGGTPGETVRVAMDGGFQPSIGPVLVASGDDEWF